MSILNYFPEIKLLADINCYSSVNFTNIRELTPVQNCPLISSFQNSL